MKKRTYCSKKGGSTVGSEGRTGLHAFKVSEGTEESSAEKVRHHKRRDTPPNYKTSADCVNVLPRTGRVHRRRIEPDRRKSKGKLSNGGGHSKTEKRKFCPPELVDYHKGKANRKPIRSSIRI